MAENLIEGIRRSAPFSDAFKIHDGLEPFVGATFVDAPGDKIWGVAWADDLISLDTEADKIYRHDGISDTILDSFATPGSWGSGLAHSLDNLISSDLATNKIYIHDGISSTILESFETREAPCNLTFDGTNLISVGYYSRTVRIHSGVTSTITDDFQLPSNVSVPKGIAYYITDGNLISAGYDAPYNYIFIHDGVSSTITDSFDAGADNDPWCLTTDVLPFSQSISPDGILTNENFGNTWVIRTNLILLDTNSILTQEAFGDTKVNQQIVPTGVASSEGFGTAEVALAPYLEIASTDIDIQLMIFSAGFGAEVDIQLAIDTTEETLYAQVDVDPVETLELGLYAEGTAYVPSSQDFDNQIQIYSTYSTDIDTQAKIYDPDSVDIDNEIYIYSGESVDIDNQIYISGLPVPGPSFLVREPSVETHDYTERVESVGIIRRFLNKTFGISQVGNVSVVCQNSDKTHSYMHADGDFYPSSQYIWTWAKFRCGWGAGLDQNVQNQFQGLVETLELTERRQANFVIVDVIKELLDGKTANAITFDAALVASTSLESLNPIHIVEYLINDVLGVQVFDFDTETFRDGAEPTSFDQAYTDSSSVVVSDTTWSAGSSIIEMIQDALKLVQGWIWTGGDGRIKAKVFLPYAVVGTEKHFIGSETDSDRKIMNLRLHPSRRDVINYITWTYGQTPTSYGPTSSSTSIGKYGYRPLELSTGWEVNTSVLLTVSNSLLSRYGDPPDMVTFTTSNLYGTGDGLDSEIGEVIKITDDGIGIADAYFRIIEKRDDLLGRKTEIIAEEYVGT